MIRIILVLTSLTILGHAQDVQWWRKSWDAAFEEAKRRNVPLLIAFIQDGEEANERIVSGLYKDPTFIKGTSKAVPIMACMKIHKPKEQKISGSSESVCGRFGWTKCSTHKKHEAMARTTYWKTGLVRTPTHIVVLPDGTEVDRLIDVHGTDSYLGLIAQGQKKLGGRGMSAAHYVKSQRLLRDARLAVQKQEVLASVTVLDELDKLVRGTPLAKEVKELRAKVDAIGHLALARSRELAAAGKPVEALRLLDDSIVAFESSPLRRDLKRARAKLASSKEGRVAARILKSENRARPSYDKAVVFEREKDYVNAVRAYYRVLGVAPGSPMADRARVRVDELRADKDLAAILGDVITDREADLLFKKGQRLRRQKKKADAQRVFAELVEKYPGSASAAKAKKLLGK